MTSEFRVRFLTVGVGVAMGLGVGCPLFPQGAPGRPVRFGCRWSCYGGVKLVLKYRPRTSQNAHNAASAGAVLGVQSAITPGRAWGEPWRDRLPAARADRGQ